MKKKLLTSLLIIGLAGAAIVGGTLAWFTAESVPIKNTFTAGKVAIEAGVEVTAAPDNFNPDNWNPGDEVDLEYTITNTGTKAIALRAIVAKEWFLADGVTPWEPAGNDAALVSDVTGWTAGENGYYYYNKGEDVDNKVAFGETVNFKLKVELDGAKATEEFQGKVYKVTVKFQAIQASHQKTGDEDGWEWEDFDTYNPVTP